MHNTYRLLASVRAAMLAEGMTLVECDRVTHAVATEEINEKVEQFQRTLLQLRDRFLNPVKPVEDWANTDGSLKRTSRNGQ